MKAMRWIAVGSVLVAGLGVAVGYQVARAHADGIPVPPSLYYGGTLYEGGSPVSGPRNITVRLYPAATGSGSLCEVYAPDTSVTDGEFRVGLVDMAGMTERCTAAVQANPERWVEVQVGSTVLSPRSRLGAAPYAVEAQRAMDSSPTGRLERRLAALEADNASLRAQITDPPCPAGYVRDTRATEIVLCRYGGIDGLDEMVKVGTGASAFWIDRYESSVYSGRAGTGTPYFLAETGATSFPPGFPRNGQVMSSTPVAIATSRAGVTPARWITWFQAQAACRASGKRLPTGEEWLAAGQGTRDPGANNGLVNSDCNTQASGGTLRSTGAGGTCVSVWGAQDLIGNLWEWTVEWDAGVGDLSFNTATAWPSDYNGDGTWNINSTAYNTISGTARGAPSAAPRGGYWPSGTRAGLFALYLGVGPSDWGSNVGFRCVAGGR